MPIKSFSLTKEQASLIKSEAAKRGISQSELIKQLLSNLESSYTLKKLEKIETLFNDIKQIHRETLKENRLIKKAIKYIINEDESLKQKIMYRCKERGDYSFTDFLLS